MATIKTCLIVILLLVDGRIYAHSHTSHGAEKTGHRDVRQKKHEPAWFSHSKVDDGIWKISDGGFDNIYLIEGSKKALVIDTGAGYQDIKSYVKSLTKKPLVAVNSHAHPDHAGGNHAFSRVHLHKNEIAPLKLFTSETMMRRAYRHFLNKPFPEYLQDDQIHSRAELVTIEQGFEFNLGDRIVSVYDIPGHTQGSIALFDSKTKSLFTGDSTTRMVWLQVDLSTTVEDFLDSVNTMKSISKDTKTLYAGHGNPEPASLLDDLQEVAAAIIAGTCIEETFSSFAGSGKLCRNEHVQIVFNPTKVHNN